MNPTLSLLLGRKMWLISGVVVWGELANFEPEIVMTETDGSAKRIVHGKFTLGGNAQTIRFGDLTDQRANKMPSSVNNAVIIPIARGNTGAVVQGSASSESFRLARSAPSDQPTIVDLLIIELG